MADPLVIDGFVEAFLAQAADGERDVVAIGVLSAAAAHLVLLGGRQGGVGRDLFRCRPGGDAAHRDLWAAACLR